MVRSKKKLRAKPARRKPGPKKCNGVDRDGREKRSIKLHTAHREAHTLARTAAWWCEALATDSGLSEPDRRMGEHRVTLALRALLGADSAQARARLVTEDLTLSAEAFRSFVGARTGAERSRFLESAADAAVSSVRRADPQLGAAMAEHRAMVRDAIEAFAGRNVGGRGKKGSWSKTALERLLRRLELPTSRSTRARNPVQKDRS